MNKKILLSAAVAGLTFAPALTAITSCAKKENLSESHIISINDFHGAAPGYGDTTFASTNKQNAGAIRLAQEFEDIKAKYPGSFVISAGDLNSGESFSTCEKGETLYPVLKQMDVRYSTLGNHAWEWGSKPLDTWHFDSLARTKDTIGNYFFTSNVLNTNKLRNKTWCYDPNSYAFAFDYKLWKDNLLPWADPFKIVDMNGHNVCLIGLTTNSTLEDGELESMKSLSFIDYFAAVVYSKAYAYEILGEDEYDKIEAFILDTHLPADPIKEDKPEEGIKGEAVDLAQNIPTRVDAVIAAHSHKICGGLIHNQTLNKDIPVYQAGQQGRRYIDTALVFNDSKPKGKRLKSLTMNIVTPKIDSSSLEAATKQINDIVANTKYESVKNTAKVYETQKDIAWKNLSSPLGKVKTVEFTDYKGLPYWYRENQRKCGTTFLQSPTLIEPAGIWASLAMVEAFNKHYEQYISSGVCYKPCVAFTNVDSLARGFSFDKSTTETEKEIIKNDVYQMHPFENKINYGCLTVNQLIQYIKYFLAGVGPTDEDKFDYNNYTPYNQKVYYDDEASGEIKWDEKEVVNKSKPSAAIKTGTSYCSAPNQFFGISFEVTKGEKYGEHNVYTLKEDTVKIYDPNTNTCKVEDPTTWILATEWKSKTSYNGYIPILIADYTWQGGNGQNRMIHHWFDYNAKKDKLAGQQVYDLYTRGSAIEYIQMLVEQGKPLNQIADGKYIDSDYITATLKINP